MRLAKLVDERFQIALNKLAAEPLPLKTSFKIKGMIKRTQEEFQKYDEVRKEALKKHGSKADDGSLIIRDNGNVALEGAGLDSFVKDLNDLLSLEVDIGTLPIAELGDNIKMSAEDLLLIEDILV